MDSKIIRVSDYREAAIASQPEVQEIFGGPEFFADGAIYQSHHSGQVYTSIYYVERTVGGKTMRVEVARVHFARQAWETAHERALAVLRATIDRA
jgi:hypothetical protein